VRDVAKRELTGSPSMTVLFARAALAMIPGATHLPFVGPMVAGGGRDVPDLILRRTDVEVDGARLADYDNVCGFALRGLLPATYPHLLAFPLQLSLMTDPSFPFPPIGLVHIANRITQHRPIHAGERLAIDVWATPVEDHARGKQFSLLSEVRVGDELVWEEVSTNLKRGHDGGSGSTSGSGFPDVPNAKDLPATATWQLPGDLGRRYASVSGDYNPIHIHPLSARLFGFPSAIAHGMWTKARCLAALEPPLPNAFTVEVAFKRPIVLPGKVEFCEARNADGIDFGVRDPAKRKSHLDGRVTFARGAAVRRRRPSD
jgi:acyl dehydratase